jgi:hypothetical protein
MVSTRIFVVVASLGLAVLPACTQMPTEKQGVADMRPQLSFKFYEERLENARVLVDGLDMGVISDYQDGKAALRILPGNHVVRVELGGQPVIEEKIYVGDGVNRTVLVK